MDVLKKIRAEFSDENITLIWDGASYHRGKIVRLEAEKLNINIEFLPAYSPDFMPVEHLWQWFREAITYHQCYDDEWELINQAAKFEQRINENPEAIADRLRTKTTIDPKEEELRFSK